MDDPTYRQMLDLGQPNQDAVAEAAVACIRAAGSQVLQLKQHEIYLRPEVAFRRRFLT